MNGIWVGVSGWLAFCCVASPVGAKRDACNTMERRLAPGTVIYGGPGLGFEAIGLQQRPACVRVLRTTEDGAFALVQHEKGRTGWVPTGLVDENLVERSEVKPLPAGAEAWKSTHPVVLRESPRPDSPGTVFLEQAVVFETLGESADGLWLYLGTATGKGWLPRYQVVSAVESDKAAQVAAPWRVRRGASAEVAPKTPERVPVAEVDAPAGEPSREAAQPSPAGMTSDGGEQGGSAPEGAAAAAPEELPPADALVAAGDSSVPTPAASTWLGRSSELGISGSVAGFGQRYHSNAQNDPFYRYAVQSVGGGGAVSYALRGDFPFVVDARANLGVFGFDILAAGADGLVRAYYQNVFQSDVWLSGGYRWFASEDVDVEVLLGLGSSLVWLDGLPDADGTLIPAFTPAIYGPMARPGLLARSRLGGGALGTVVMEAAIPVGMYAMFDDPGARYINARAQNAINPPAASNIPGQPVDPAAAPSAETPAPLTHLALGFEGRVRYQIPVSTGLALETGAGIELRQAWIQGPGLRVKGAYSEAVNVDLTGSLTVGVLFGL